MTDTTTDTTIAHRESRIITSPEQYLEKLQKWQELHYNVLTPFTNMNDIAASHGLYVGIVRLSLDPRDEETYSGYTASGAKGMPFLKGERGASNEEFAIAKRGLLKLAELAGISFDSDRVDPRTIPNYWEYKATATYTSLDGSKIQRTANKIWDLRDGSDQMKGWTPQQITEGRKNGPRNCESRAINAAIRSCGAGVKQKYTRAELERPFVVVRVSFQPDLKDPAIKAMVTRHALGGVRALYPQRPALAEPIDVEPVTRDARQRDREAAPTGATPAAESGAAPPRTATAPAPPADAPPNQDAVKIRAVESFTGETKGRAWTKYTVVDSNGVEHVTFSSTTAEEARAYQKAGTWVEILREPESNKIDHFERAQANLPGLDEV